MFIKNSFLVALLFLTALYAGEKNSTPCFSVGELGERWELGSDHLPTAISVGKRHFVSWNILDKRCMRWIETNSQGLVDSAITREDFPVSPGAKLTLREERIIKQIVAMATHETHPRSLIALQEVHPDVYAALKTRLPMSYVPVTTFPGDLAHGDLFLFDSAIFELVGSTGNTFYDSHNTWMILTLRDREDGKLFSFVQSHVPGGDFSPIARNQLAYQTLTHLDPAAITLVVGDQNRSPDYFMADLERVAHELGWKENPFTPLDLLYPTHVNTLQEASWIDNLFIAGPLYQAGPLHVSQSANELFADLASPIKIMWEFFPVDTKAKLPKHERIQALYQELMEKWRLHYLKEEGNFNLKGLIDAVSFASEKHEGQKRKDAAATPYIIHPLQVCRNLWEIGGIRNANILIAALLHDTLEDTDTTEDEIARRFSPRIAEIVKEITEPNKEKQMQHAPYLSQDARLVKLADRLANITDLSVPPPSWPEEKVKEYYGWGAKLLHALRGTNAPLEKALETQLRGNL